MAGAVSTSELAAAWLSMHGAGAVDESAAQAWLDHRGVAGALERALTGVIHKVWIEGWLIGDVSAQTMLAVLGPRPDSGTKGILTKAPNVDIATDWGNWTPGDWRAADAIINGSGRYPGLRALIKSGQVTIKSIADNKLVPLRKILEQAAREGWARGKTAKALGAIVSDPRRARQIAGTELARATSAGALARYRDNGVDAKEWMDAEDQRVCPICSENADQGAIPVDALFSSGDDAPPGHPDCRCAPAPAWLSVQDARSSGEDLSGIPGLEDAEVVGADELGALGLADEEGAEIAEEQAEVDEWEAELAEIRAAVESGVDVQSDNLGGSVSGDVRRVRTNDGQVLVRKVLKDPYRNPDETEAVEYQRDAEVLAARVARAAGLEAPAVVPTGERGAELWMTFMRGRLALDDAAAARTALESDQGILMRLVNLLTDNGDGWKNEGNWLISDGNVQLIDQSFAFQPWGAAEDVPSWGHWTPDFTSGEGWKDNPLSPRDVERLRGRLQELEPAFDELGRRAWFDKMMTRLDVIGRHAVGGTDILL